MIPWERLECAPVPGNGGEICLYRRGEEYSIRVNGHELMNSSAHGSEEALAELACERITGNGSPRILIGGLGMGFTLASSLKCLSPGARIVVSELVPAVVKWNRGPLAELSGNPLQDGRVTVSESDVGQVLKQKKRAYDAILLDVDNGPEGLTREGNDRLYSQAGLETSFAALRPEGVLAVWSAAPDRAFARRLRRSGFEVDEVCVRARGSRGGGRHTIWIAVRGFG
ncbi:MAG TPA: spermidine synthase [Nitrospirae bacterium]|nr:spermidine synthase [Nitrospirota bacterium]